MLTCRKRAHMWASPRHCAASIDRRRQRYGKQPPTKSMHLIFSSIFLLLVSRRRRWWWYLSSAKLLPWTESNSDRRWIIYRPAFPWGLERVQKPIKSNTSVVVQIETLHIGAGIEIQAAVSSNRAGLFIFSRRRQKLIKLCMCSSAVSQPAIVASELPRACWPCVWLSRVKIFDESNRMRGTFDS